MKKILFIFFLLFLTQNLFSQRDDEINTIGQNTSELLINKVSIEKSKYAIKIEKLFPKEDFSKFKDSPAEFILNILHGAELELPNDWNELLNNANKSKIDHHSNYVKTYFLKMGVDNYIATSVIKSNSKYFIFSYKILKWEKDFYISKFYNVLREFANIEEIESNPFVIIQEEIEKETNELDDNESEKIIIGIEPKNK